MPVTESNQAPVLASMAVACVGAGRNIGIPLFSAAMAVLEVFFRGQGAEQSERHVQLMQILREHRNILLEFRPDSGHPHYNTGASRVSMHSGLYNIRYWYKGQLKRSKRSNISGKICKIIPKKSSQDNSRGQI